jgi:hypothetical protein
MKKKLDNNIKLQTRAELINSSRTSGALDRLPSYNENMFDVLSDFKPGTRKFIKFNQPTNV